MTPSQLIAAKRDGRELSVQEIEWLIQRYVAGDVPDYQMSAFAMAVYFQGMSAEETVALTKALLHSGTTMQWSTDIRRVDKHSTGGVGDKVSLVLAPLLACFDLQVPMVSGRGLGATGGTLDKLESIPGFRTNLTTRELQSIVEDVGCVISGASDELAPADRTLYALRDVTATVASQPLIVSSILSKKLAENLTSLVLDVKVGSGAFMKTTQAARSLARSLVDVGTLCGMKTKALVTNMHQPLGRAVGNALEVQEAMDTLRQRGESGDDLVQLSVRLGAELLQAEGLVATEEQAQQLLLDKLNSGEGFEKFQAMVAAQGGSLAGFHGTALKPISVVAEQSGYVHAIDGAAIGDFVIQLGGGRQVVTDQIDFAVGLELPIKVGMQVRAGDELARVYARGDFDPAAIRQAIDIAEQSTETLPLVLERVE